MFFWPTMERDLIILFCLACVGVIGLLASAGWGLWFLVSHLVWAS
jgi:hypothetical protein